MFYKRIPLLIMWQLEGHPAGVDTFVLPCARGVIRAIGRQCPALAGQALRHFIIGFIDNRTSLRFCFGWQSKRIKKLNLKEEQ